MGNNFVIRGKSITVTPLKSHTEVIQKIPSPKMSKDCKSFCGWLNYLSLFCEGLHKLLKPITDLTRKAMPFVWIRPQESAFNEIKRRISSSPFSIFHAPLADSSCILIQVGNTLTVLCGKFKKDASKTLPPACKNYSVTAIDMTGLLVRNALWKVYLKQCEFDACVEHAAVV